MKINNLKWKIFYDKDLGENYLGTTDYFALEIKINPLVKDKSNLDRTIMHEVIHAYLYSYGFTNKDEFKLEEMVEFISHNVDSIIALSAEAGKELEEVSNNEKDNGN